MSGKNADVPIQDASTVIVLRDADDGLETFMVCRHHRSGFMGGAHVFPGGKVDEADLDSSWQGRVTRPAEELAERLGEADAGIALGLLVAAVRETFEEAGVLLASTGSGAALHAIRERLREGASFLSIADEIDLKIDPMMLAPYARWITPEIESRRFDTRFYIAVLPQGQGASHDGAETTSAAWLRPVDAIEEMRTGRVKLAPPTVRTLKWLADFDDAASVIAAALSRRPPLVRPRVVARDGGWFLALPGDPEHPEGERVLPGATRMILSDGAWLDVP
jgi:8-oxo-dGTP pyrophosphatase MutT (NUDIX family)